MRMRSLPKTSSSESPARPRQSLQSARLSVEYWRRGAHAQYLGAAAGTDLGCFADRKLLRDLTVVRFHERREHGLALIENGELPRHTQSAVCYPWRPEKGMPQPVAQQQWPAAVAAQSQAPLTCCPHSPRSQEARPPQTVLLTVRTSGQSSTARQQTIRGKPFSITRWTSYRRCVRVTGNSSLP